MGGALTQEQRTKMREAMQASQSDMTALTEKLSAAQKEAIKAVLAKDADEKSVRPKIEAVAKIQTDIAVLRLKAVKEISSTITDEQKTQLEATPAIGYNALVGGFGGGMGGGRGRRGGGAGGAGGGNN
jgi:Spy/CpxP family protein refolding chaperone